MKSRSTLRLLGVAGALCSINTAMGAIYYVSPTGSDTNSGTSPSSPWQSLAKVDATSFAPGSQILFQAGGNWYGSQLTASSSGTPSQPITYGSYGSGPNPTFWGSVPFSDSSIQPVTGTSYFIPYNTPVNAFLINHQFLNNAELLTNSSDPATNIAYVENTPNSAYYVTTGTHGELFNLGSNINSLDSSYFPLSACVQDDVIAALNQNNLVFDNLTVRESAKYNAGYGIRVQNANNVTVENCTVTAAGKHAVGAIDAGNFLGENITSSYLMPNQQYGGATAFVSYADYNVANISNQWINDSFTNPNGQYQAFITHDTPSGSVANPIASVLVKNLTAQSDPAITVFSESTGENVSIIGGSAAGQIQIVGGNTVVNGVTLTGPDGAFGISGNNNTIENNTINGDDPEWPAGRNAAIDVSGPGNIIRFNTVNLELGTGLRQASVGIETPNSNTQVYGNVFNGPYATFFQAFAGLPGIDAHDNLLSGTSTPMVIYPFQNFGDPLSQWPTSMSANEIVGDADFVDPADGNLSIGNSNVGEYVFNPASNEYVMYDYYGNVRPTILATMGAIQAPSNGLTGVSWNVDSDGNWSNTSNWTNGIVPNSTDIIAILSTAISAPRTVTVDAPQTVGILYFTSAASFTVSGSSTLTFNSSSGSSAIDVSAGNHTISAPINLSDSTSVNLAGTSTLTISGAVTGAGPLIANGGGDLLIAPSASIGVPLVANGNLTFGANTSGGIMVDRISSLSVGNRGLVTLADPGAANRSNRMLFVVQSLNFASPTSGTLDVTRNDVDIENTTLAAVTADLLTGLNLSGLVDTGGILSSTASADPTHLTTLGVLQNIGTNGKAIYGTGAPLGLFDGYSPALNDVLIKFTYYGDANLDGQVDSSDYSRIDAGFLQKLTGWSNGDFNYDGVVNGSDYTLIDNAFNTQGASLAIQVAPTVQIAAEIADGNTSITAVPEPTTTALVTIAGLGVLRRRRRI